MHVRSFARLSVLSAFALVGCEVATVSTGQPQLVSVTIESTATTVEIGATAQLAARANFDDGRSQDVSGAVLWELTDATVATVSPSGELTGVAPGSTRITARSEQLGLEGSIDLTVVEPAEILTGLSFGQSQVTLGVSFRRRLVVTGTFSTQRTVDLTSQVSLTSSNPSVADFSAAEPGLLLGVSQGQTTITALDPTSALEVRAEVQVLSATTGAVLQSVRLVGPEEAIALGDSLLVRAVGEFDDGTEADLDAEDLAWSTSDDAVLAGAEPGVFSAVGAGSTSVGASVTAASPPIVAPALSLTVEDRSFTALEVTAAGDQTSVLEGQSLSLVAVAQTAALSRDVTGIVEWTVDEPSRATVDDSGNLTALTEGAVAVTATWSSASLSDTYGITVAPVLITGLTSSSTDIAMVPGDSRSLDVQGELNDGSSTSVTALLDWTSSDPSIVTVSDTGVLDAQGGADYASVPRGTVTVTGTDPETSESIQFTVTSFERVEGSIDGVTGALTMDPTGSPGRIAAVIDAVTNGVIPGDSEMLEIDGEWNGSGLTISLTTPLGTGPYELADGNVLMLEDATGVFRAANGLTGTSASVTVINNPNQLLAAATYRVVATLCRLSSANATACDGTDTFKSLDVTVQALRDHARGSLENPYLFELSNASGGYRISPGEELFFQVPIIQPGPASLGWKLGYEDNPELTVEVFADASLEDTALAPDSTDCAVVLGAACATISPDDLPNLIQFIDTGTAVIRVTLDAAASAPTTVLLEPTIGNQYLVSPLPPLPFAFYVQSGSTPSSDPEDATLLGDTSLYFLGAAAPPAGQVLRLTLTPQGPVNGLLQSIDDPTRLVTGLVGPGTPNPGPLTLEIPASSCSTTCTVQALHNGAVFPTGPRPFGSLAILGFEYATP